MIKVEHTYSMAADIFSLPARTSRKEEMCCWSFPDGLQLIFRKNYWKGFGEECYWLTSEKVSIPFSSQKSMARIFIEVTHSFVFCRSYESGLFEPDGFNEIIKSISSKEKHLFSLFGNSLLQIGKENRREYSTRSEIEELGRSSFLCINGKKSNVEERYEAIQTFIRTFFLQGKYEHRRVFFDSKVVILVASRGRKAWKGSYVLLADSQSKNSRVINYRKLKTESKELFFSNERNLVTFRNIQSGLIVLKIAREWKVNHEISFVQIGNDIVAKTLRDKNEECYTTAFTSIFVSKNEIPLEFEEKYFDAFPSLVKEIIIFYKWFLGRDLALEEASKRFHTKNGKAEAISNYLSERCGGKIEFWDWPEIANWTYINTIDEHKIYLLKLKNSVRAIFRSFSGNQIIFPEIEGNLADKECIIRFPKEIYLNPSQKNLTISNFNHNFFIPVFEDGSFFGHGRVFLSDRSNLDRYCLRIDSEEERRSDFILLSDECSSLLKKEPVSDFSVILEGSVKVQRTRSLFNSSLELNSRKSVLCLYVNSPNNVNYFSIDDLIANFTGHAVVILEKVNGGRYETFHVDAIRGENNKLKIRKGRCWKNDPSRRKKAWSITGEQVDIFMRIFNSIKTNHIAQQPFRRLRFGRNTQNCLSFSYDLLKCCGIPDEQLPEPSFWHSPSTYAFFNQFN